VALEAALAVDFFTSAARRESRAGRRCVRLPAPFDPRGMSATRSRRRQPSSTRRATYGDFGPSMRPNMRFTGSDGDARAALRQRI